MAQSKGEKPGGLLAAAASFFFAATLALIIAWIWDGDARFGWTALVTAPVALLALGLSISQPEDSEKEGGQ